MYEAQAKWRRENLKGYSFCLNKNVDQKYMDFLAKKEVPISQLVREAIERRLGEWD